MKLIKIEKTAANEVEGAYSSVIAQGMKELQDEMKRAAWTAGQIQGLEAQIIERAQNNRGVSEGSDYYGRDYISQTLDPRIKEEMVSLEEEGNIFDFQGVLRKYMLALKSILDNMDR